MTSALTKRISSLVAVPNSRVLVVTDRLSKFKLLVDHLGLSPNRPWQDIWNGSRLYVTLTTNENRYDLAGYQATAMLVDIDADFSYETLRWFLERVRAPKSYEGKLTTGGFYMDDIREEDDKNSNT